ncbi:MAG: energy transducer TonB [Ignavibacteriaceae bacterium]|nr:energy transducer TonB [Ignavibacteriaceae bacterium]
MATRAEERQRSVAISLFFHFLLFLFLFFYRIEAETEVQEFIEIGFGGDGSTMFSGVPGLNSEEEQKSSDQVEEKNDDVNLPKAGENPEDPSIKKVDEKKPEENKNTNNNQNSNSQNSGGSSGYDIDWGGMGQRKIYSFILPAYPEGVSKNIDIRIRFTILPDGTVGSIFLLAKADTRLENAAITSLRQWRFEPLPARQNQIIQTAVITFPYRVQ